MIKMAFFQGSTPCATIIIKGSALPDNIYYELDVTNLVKEYVSGKYENKGLLIKAVVKATIILHSQQLYYILQ